MVIRYRLDELLRLRRLTAKEVAKLTGIAESTLSEIRRNRAKRIDTQTIDRLCKALQCTPGDLIVYIPDNALPAVAEPPGEYDPRG